MNEQSTADMLSVLHDAPIAVVDGGFRVKETETSVIDVQRMIFNWRVSRTPKADLDYYDRAYCYYGTSVLVLLRAVSAALEWDGADDTDPVGWDKNALTGEYAAVGAGR